MAEGNRLLSSHLAGRANKMTLSGKNERARGELVDETKTKMLLKGCVKLCKIEAAGCCVAGSLMLISFSQKIHRFHSAAINTEILFIITPDTLFHFIIALRAEYNYVIIFLNTCPGGLT